MNAFLVGILVLWSLVGGGFMADAVDNNALRRWSNRQYVFVCFFCGPAVWVFASIVGVVNFLKRVFISLK